MRIDQNKEINAELSLAPKERTLVFTAGEDDALSRLQICQILDSFGKAWLD
jgi:hypothetical protein